MHSKNKLIASVIINFIIFAVSIGIISSYFMGNLSPEVRTPMEKFCFFTTDSNLLGAIGALAVAVYNIRILKGKSTRIPFFVMILKFSGVVSLLLTLSTVVFLLIPVYGAAKQFGETLFHLHLMAPLMSFVSFTFLDGFDKIKLSNTVWGLIPMLVYGNFYYWRVIVLGINNGGWIDFYAFNQNGKWYISLMVVIIATFLLGLATLLVHNLFCREKGFVPRKAHKQAV